MIKRKLSLLALALPVLAVSSAMADPTAGPSGELIVTGTYTPPACSVSLAGNGTIDYGRIQSSSLSKDNYTTLATKTLANALTINCPTATSVALAWQDNRQSSVSNITVEDATTRTALLPEIGGGAFSLPLGLGVDSAGHKIGNYVAELYDFKVDGNAAYTGRYDYPFTAGSGVHTSAFYFLTPPSSQLAVNIVDDKNALAVGRVFTMAFSVNAQIAPTSGLDLSKEITLDGSSTVSLYYL